MNRPFTFLDKLPEARFLVEAGVKPASAAKLIHAGYTSLESLARASRDDLLSVRGISTRTLEQLEGLLGYQLHSPSGYWREKGLLPKYAKILARAGIDSVQALEKMSRKELRALGLGSLALEQCEELLGRPLDSPGVPKRVPVEEPSPAQSSQARAEWEASYHRLLEMLVPLQSRESPPLDGAEVRLRLALWNVARELVSFLGEAPAGLDLTRNDAATGEALYSYVVQQYFSLRLLDDPGLIHVPTHTPEECQLRVFNEYGRWFVTWIRLEEDMSRPEVLTRELLVIDTDQDGRVKVTEV